jgi:hypothetical protein
MPVLPVISPDTFVNFRLDGATIEIDDVGERSPLSSHLIIIGCDNVPLSFRGGLGTSACPVKIIDGSTLVVSANATFALDIFKAKDATIAKHKNIHFFLNDSFILYSPFLTLFSK